MDLALSLSLPSLAGGVIPVPPGPGGEVPTPPPGFRLWAIDGKPFFMDGTYWAIAEA